MPVMMAMLTKDDDGDVDGVAVENVDVDDVDEFVMSIVLMMRMAFVMCLMLVMSLMVLAMMMPMRSMSLMALVHRD